MEGEERYLGSVTSANLKRGIITGYGIYVTNRRIIGIKNSSGVAVGALIGAVAGAIIQNSTTRGTVTYRTARQSTQDFTRSYVPASWEDLEKKKDFAVGKPQILAIEVKKPTFWHRGHLLISLKKGKPIKVIINGNGEFEDVRKLVQTFAPELMRVT